MPSVESVGLRVMLPRQVPWLHEMTVGGASVRQAMHVSVGILGLLNPYHTLERQDDKTNEPKHRKGGRRPKCSIPDQSALNKKRGCRTNWFRDQCQLKIIFRRLAAGEHLLLAQGTYPGFCRFSRFLNMWEVFLQLCTCTLGFVIGTL